jgi:hypothetical protein
MIISRPFLAPSHLLFENGGDFNPKCKSKPIFCVKEHSVKISEGMIFSC